MKKVELEIYKSSTGKSLGISIGRFKENGYGEGSVIVGPSINRSSPLKVFELNLEQLENLKEEINFSIKFLKAKK